MQGFLGASANSEGGRDKLFQLLIKGALFLDTRNTGEAVLQADLGLAGKGNDIAIKHKEDNRIEKTWYT